MTDSQAVLDQANAFLQGAVILTTDYDRHYPRLDRERTFRLANEFIARAKHGFDIYAVNMQQKEISR